MLAIEYLEAYNAQLDMIDTVDDLYKGLLDWQWDQMAARVQAQEELNSVFFAKPNAAAFQLRSENPPTTSVGGFDGIVAIAANPATTKGPMLWK